MPLVLGFAPIRDGVPILVLGELLSGRHSAGNQAGNQAGKTADEDRSGLERLHRGGAAGIRIAAAERFLCGRRAHSGFLSRRLLLFTGSGRVVIRYHAHQPGARPEPRALSGSSGSQQQSFREALLPGKPR